MPTKTQSSAGNACQTCSIYRLSNEQRQEACNSPYIADKNNIVRVPRPDFGPYPALRVKVFFFEDSGSLDGMLQFPGG